MSVGSSIGDVGEIFSSGRSEKSPLGAVLPVEDFVDSLDGVGIFGGFIEAEANNARET